MSEPSTLILNGALAAESAARRLHRAWSLSVYANRPDAVEMELRAARAAYEELGAQLAALEAPKLPPLRGLRLVETAVGVVELPHMGRIGDPPPSAA